jgi:ATP-dependent Clp protease ATP-binding subunit ClpC
VLFTHAPAEARQLGHNHIGPEHLLLGLLHEDDAITADLTGLGARPPQVRHALLGLLAAHAQPPAPAEDTAGLQDEITRLRALLRQHGIEPGSATARPA